MDSEAPAAFIFRIEECVLHSPEDEGCSFTTVSEKPVSSIFGIGK
jgi:hypothetical protein